MPRIVLRVRPEHLLDDLDLKQLKARLRKLSGWKWDLRDSRLADAPYVTVVAETSVLGAHSVASLQSALSELDSMRAVVWMKIGVERPLESCDVAAMKKAALSVQELDRETDIAGPHLHDPRA